MHSCRQWERQEAAFAGLRTPLLLASLEANVPLSRRRRRTPTPLSLPVPKQKAGPRSLSSGSARGRPAFARSAAGKPRPSVALWSASACARTSSSPTLPTTGGEFRRPLSLRRHRLKPTLCSHLRARGAPIYPYGYSADILCWFDWCVVSALRARSRRRLTASP